MKNIYFADLTHTAQGVQAKCMPLGAALVASYIKREFKDFFGVSPRRAQSLLRRMKRIKEPGSD